MLRHLAKLGTLGIRRATGLYKENVYTDSVRRRRIQESEQASNQSEPGIPT